MNEPNKNIDTIVEEVSRLDSEQEQASYLDEVCADNPDLRDRVERRLASTQRANEFFSDAVTEEAEPISLVEAPTAEGPGGTIGNYKLLQKIGEGGFGVVYLARQSKPVTRDVALKIIKLGMDTKQVVGRFEAERQALAMMDHPNIAKVLDAGSTDSGRPYFCMELVKGIPITTYCDNNHLTTRERLDLFTSVCHAVHHAHQNGIIHRDIKPSNVMVTLHDGKPVPKVIDFGIAKATQQRLTEKTVFTQYSQLIGTPAYMSPEQAEMSGLNVDTRTDVYSLGVLLYELLTGRPPFDPQELQAKGYDEMRRIVREVEPPKPSTRLSTLKDDELTTVAQHRKLQPDKLGRTVRGELDWIVMKALEKDRTRRYDSSYNFADDISRYLNHQPVVAAAPSVLYNFRKFAKRNKSTFAVGVSFALLLIVATAVSSWQAIRASRAERKAVAEAETATTVKDYLITGLIASASPYSKSGNNKDTTVKEFLESAAKEIEDKFSDQPYVEADLRHLIGKSHLVLQERDEAERHLRRALTLRTKLFGRDNEKTIDTMQFLGRTLRNSDRFDEAREILSEAATTAREALGPGHELTLWSELSLTRNERLQNGYSSKGRLETERILETAQQHLNKTNDVYLNALFDLGRIYLASDLLKLSESVFRKQQAIQNQVLPPYHADRLTTLNGLTSVLKQQERYDESLRFAQQGVDLALKQFGTNNNQYQFARVLLAGAQIASGEVESVEKMLEDAAAQLERLVGSDAYYTRGAYHYLAEVYAMTKRFTEAEAINKKTQQIFQSNYGPTHYFNEFAAMDLMFLEIQRGNFPQALEHAQNVSPDSSMVEASQRFGFSVLEFFNREPNALTPFRESLLNRTKRTSPLQLQYLLRVDCLSDSPLILREGDATLREFMAASESLLPDNWKALTPKTYLGLGMGAYRLGEFERAIAYLKQSDSTTPWIQAQKQYFLAMAQHQVGSTTEAKQSLSLGQTLEANAPTPTDTTLGQQWAEALVCQVAQKEALRLIQAQ